MKEGAFVKRTNIISQLLNRTFLIVPIIAFLVAAVILLTAGSNGSFFGVLLGTFRVEIGEWIWKCGTLNEIYIESPMTLVVRLVAMAIVLLLGLSIIDNPMFQCPHCYHFFCCNRISNIEYEGSTFRRVSYKENDHHIATTWGSDGEIYLTGYDTTNTQYGREETKRYKYYVQCEQGEAIMECKETETNTTWD